MKKVKKSLKIKKTEQMKKLYTCFVGALSGLVNGLFGGGGGMLVVPLLIFLLGIEVKKAHATAILVILPISIVSGLLYAAHVNLQPSIAIPVSIGVVVGGGIGALLLSKLSNKVVIIIFSVVMAIAGGKMLLF